jgi:hypothetical protein
MAKPKGGARPGAGRKPNAIEDNVKAHIKAAMTDADLKAIWQKIVEMSKSGSEKHTQILMSYYYGKPKENEGQPTEMIISVKRTG